MVCFCRLLQNKECVKLYLMVTTILCIAKSQLLLFYVDCIVRHGWHNVFIASVGYCGLLELWYGDKQNKTLTTKEKASRDGFSIREMEWHMDAEMLLDEYILQEMFLQATHSGWKEVKQMIH